MLQMVVAQYRRFFRRSPLLALLAIVVLAVGFSGAALTYPLMIAMSAPRSAGFRPMQYATIAEETGIGGSQPISWKSYLQLTESAGWSDPVLITYSESILAHVNYQQNEQQVSVAGTSNGFFSVFTDGLDTGHDFSSSWQSSRGAMEVILSRPLAEKLFSDASSALGRNITLNNQSFRVIGVAPKTLFGLWSPTDAWVTPERLASLEFDTATSESRPSGENHSPLRDNPDLWQKISLFYVFAGSARLSPVSLHQRLENLIHSPRNVTGHLHVVDGLSKDPVWETKIRSWARLAFVLSIGLILAAALNYCGVLLAQAPRYVEEVRLKRVLGAGALRIVLENMCGPVVTVLLGFVVAACVVLAGFRLVGWKESGLFSTGAVSWQLMPGTLGITLVTACGLAVVVGAVPSLRLLRDSGVPRIGYTTTPGGKANFVLDAIVSGQIASCILICLIAAMILGAVRSMAREVLGFDANQLRTVEIGPALRGATIQFSTAGAGDFPLATFARLTVENSQAKVFGVESISAASCAPLAQPMKTINIQPIDRESPPHSVYYCGVSQGFFETMGNAIIEGRGFLSRSFTGDVSEVVINRQLANELWPGEDPLHRTLRVEEPAWALEFNGEVVGVAQDMRFSGLASTPQATLFLPLKGNVFTLSFPLYFLAKGTGPSRSLEEFIRQQAVNSMPSLAVRSSYQVDERLQRSFLEQEVRVWFASIGAALVAIIAYLGLYGVLVHSANSRRREMALRACFGASPRNLRRIVFRQALQCSASAVAISLLAWKPMTTLAASAWLGKAELSWYSALLIPSSCLIAAVGIALLPALAAGRLSPGEILREQ